MNEITSYESALEWLDAQDHQTQIWFAARCALRAIPGLYDDPSWEQGADLAIVFNCFRAGVIATAASTVRPFNLDVLEIRAASAIAALNALDADGIRRQDAKLASKNALNCIVSPTPAPHAAEALQRCSQVVDYDQIGPVSFERATRDIQDPLSWDVLWSPGYPDSDDPFKKTGILGDEWSDLHGQMGREGTNLAFWIEWYQGIVNGTPLPSELTQRIALEFEDEDWNAGPKRVSERIGEIRLKLKVKALAEELAEAAYRAQPGFRGMGDNKGPSLEDDHLPAQSVETIIWVASGELREQASSGKADKSALQKAVEVLIGLLKATGFWTARKIDKVIDAASGAFGATFGAAGGAASLAFMAGHSDKIVKLIDYALNWLPFLR